MTPQDFRQWLDGYLDGIGDHPTRDQVQRIAEKAREIESVPPWHDPDMFRVPFDPWIVPYYPGPGPTIPGTIPTPGWPLPQMIWCSDGTSLTVTQ